MTAWNGANVYVEIAFDNSPLTAIASCTWVDVTDYVRRISTNRGRTTELSGYAPGTATISLDNRARLFDSTNTAGTYYGKLLPMKRIRVRASYGATSATLFSGFVLGWPITYPGMVDSVVQVSCVDAFHLLEQSACPGSAYGAAVLADSPNYYWPMQGVGADGSLVALVGTADILQWVDTSTGATTPTNTYPYGQNLGVAGDGAAKEQWGTGFVALPSFPATVEFYVGAGTDVLEGPMLTFYATTTDFFYVSATVGYVQVWYSHGGFRDSVGSTGVKFYTPDRTSTQQYHVAVTISGTTMSVYLNGALAGTDTLAAGSYTGPYGTVSNAFIVARAGSAKSISHGAGYPTALSAARVLAHYEIGRSAHGHPNGERTGTRIGRVLDVIGWPTADRTISTGETVLGNWAPANATAMAEMRACEEVEQGLLYVGGDGTITFRDRQWQMTNTKAVTSQATFGDAAGEIQYNDITIDGNRIDFIRNVVSVSYPSATVTAKDDTSISAYGRQADSVDATSLPTFAGYLARQLAAFRLRLRKSPSVRIPSVTVDVRAGAGIATNLPALLPLELGYRVTAKRRPTGGTGSLSVACTVQGIEHAITPMTWEATYYLAPTPPSYTEAPYLTLGDATYGKIGAVAGNTIPY